MQFQGHMCYPQFLWGVKFGKMTKIELKYGQNLYYTISEKIHNGRFSKWPISP